MKAKIPEALANVSTVVGIDAVTLDAIALAHYLCETRKFQWPDENKFRKFCTETINIGVPSSTVSRVKDISSALTGERMGIMIDVNDKPHVFNMTLSFIYDLAHNFKELGNEVTKKGPDKNNINDNEVQMVWALLSVQRYFDFASGAFFKHVEVILDIHVKAMLEARGATKQ